MRCYQNSHYELRFWHNELINNGFNKSDINDLYAITKTKPIKFKIDWDKTNQPHFIFHSGSLAIDQTGELLTAAPILRELFQSHKI